jgi:hypothetical protein
VKLNRTSSQNKDIQKVDSSNCCHAMIRHENTDAMVLVSALMRGIPPGLPPFWILSGGECLSNAHRLGPWRQHFHDELRLRQSHWKIVGKTKKLGNCVAYSVTSCPQISLDVHTRHAHAITIASKMASWKTRTFALYCGLFGSKFLD